MQIGMVGLGRMGGNMLLRLKAGGHEVIGYDRDEDVVLAVEKQGVTCVRSLEELVSKLSAPRVVWVMLREGSPTEETILALGELLSPGDMAIDGGNTLFKDDVRRAKVLQAKGIDHVDVGTSGGVWGRERGYCLMIGGKKSSFEYLEPIFKTLAPGCGEIARTPGRSGAHSPEEQGYLYCGPHGAGHFAKAIHNGIEYGILETWAEGTTILKEASSEELPEEYRYELDVAAILEVWRRGSVVGSWILDLIAAALVEDPELSTYTGYVEDSGEGRWTVQAAIEEAVPAEVISAALFARFRSRHRQSFGDKLLSAARKKFGGHTEGGGKK
jgi:6-phosphogluconate dehydrogenase